MVHLLYRPLPRLPVSGAVALIPYFLWHLAQFSGLFVAQALVPLWHSPQNLPLFISAIFISVEPFFILKIFEWQSRHLRPLSACTLPSKVTLPMDASHSAVLPGGTAYAEAAIMHETNTEITIVNRFITCLLCHHFLKQVLLVLISPAAGIISIHPIKIQLFNAPSSIQALIAGIALGLRVSRKGPP